MSSSPGREGTYQYFVPGSTWDGSTQVFPRVLDAVRDLGPGARVLDAGCGNGYLTSLLSERGFRSHGVDPSETGIAVARQAYPSIPFLCLDLTQPDLDLPTFDAVTCIEVIEHVYAPGALLAAFFRVLRPGGLLVLSTPYHGYFKNLAVVASGRFDRNFNPLWDHGHIKFFSKSTLRQALHHAGFDDVAIAGVGRGPGFWKTMLATARKPGSVESVTSFILGIDAC